MELPSVRNTLRDQKNKVTYHVMAHRPPTREELIVAVRTFNAQNGRKKLKEGDEITFSYSLGV